MSRNFGEELDGIIAMYRASNGSKARYEIEAVSELDIGVIDALLPSKDFEFRRVVEGQQGDVEPKQLRRAGRHPRGQSFNVPIEVQDRT